MASGNETLTVIPLILQKITDPGQIKEFLNLLSGIGIMEKIYE